MKDLEYYLSLNYAFIINRDVDGSYFLKYLDLPGCMTCAPTLDEVIKMGEDAKFGWLEIAIQQKRVIPEPKSTEQYSGEFRLRIPKELHKEIAIDAEEEGVSMNQYCVYLLSKGRYEYKKKAIR